MNSLIMQYATQLLTKRSPISVCSNGAKPLMALYYVIVGVSYFVWTLICYLS